MVGGSNQLAGGENFSLLLMATRNPAVANQLRLVVYLIIYRVLAPSQVVVSLISSINGGNTLGIRDFCFLWDGETHSQLTVYLHLKIVSVWKKILTISVKMDVNAGVKNHHALHSPRRTVRTWQ